MDKEIYCSKNHYITRDKWDSTKSYWCKRCLQWFSLPVVGQIISEDKPGEDQYGNMCTIDGAGNTNYTKPIINKEKLVSYIKRSQQ